MIISLVVLFTYIVHKYEELNNIAKKICIFAGRTICHPIRIVQDDNTSLEFTRVQRRPPAAFLLIRAITRGASGTKTFLGSCLTHMKSFIKIGGMVLEL